MKIVKCKYCGKEFETNSKHTKYCSYSCENKSRYKDAVCLNCGKVFRKCGPNVSCCSPSCGKQYQNRDLQRRETTVKCAICGKEFTKRTIDCEKTEKRNGKHYCSQECMGESFKDRITLICSQCGKEFQRARSGVDLNNKHYFCSKECQKINTDYILKGIDHYGYKTGKTCYKRGENWLKVRRAVYERDNNTCQICGRTQEEVGKKLSVHHIKPYRLFGNYEEANNLENLITLCQSCHMIEEYKLKL